MASDPLTPMGDSEQSGIKRNPIDNIPPEKRFQPGRSGNPGGRPKKRLITDQLEKLLKQKDPKTGKPNAELVAAGLIKMLAQGKNAKELLDRIEGPVPQVQEHTGAGGAPLTITFTQAVPPEEPADE